VNPGREWLELPSLAGRIELVRQMRAVLSGRIGFDRSLDLRGRAIVAAERVAAGVDSVHELARLRKASGEVIVPLTITGSLDAPNSISMLEASSARVS
jgi:hypothetical protein